MPLFRGRQRGQSGWQHVALSAIACGRGAGQLVASRKGLLPVEVLSKVLQLEPACDRRAGGLAEGHGERAEGELRKLEFLAAGMRRGGCGSLLRSVVS
mmetsp:Transcript_18007/g.47581  ORF Transcript_18007/g.47581 Transcript_18007/m.47581 type:complete len:98 (-) Transcript_18007:91-384(-)